MSQVNLPEEIARAQPRRRRFVLIEARAMKPVVAAVSGCGSASVAKFTAPKRIAAVKCIEVERTLAQVGRNLHEKNLPKAKNFLLRASRGYLTLNFARFCKQCEQTAARLCNQPFRK